MLIKFPRGVVIDTANISNDFDARIAKAFADYTEGTAAAYRYQDKLAFIDLMSKYLHDADDPEDSVKRLILESTEWTLEEHGSFPSADDFWSMDFMAACYERGVKDQSLYDHYTGDCRTDDVIMQLLVRAIKVVMDYEEG